MERRIDKLMNVQTEEQWSTILNEWAPLIGRSMELFSAPRLDHAIDHLCFKEFELPTQPFNTLSYSELASSVRGCFELFPVITFTQMGENTQIGWGIVDVGSWVKIEVNYEKCVDHRNQVIKIWKECKVFTAGAEKFFGQGLTSVPMHEYLYSRIGSIIESWRDKTSKRVKRGEELNTFYQTENFLLKEIHY